MRVIQASVRSGIMSSYRHGHLTAVMSYTPESLRWMQFRALFLVFIRSLNPDERLDVNHVAWGKIPKVGANGVGKCEQARVSRSARAGFIPKVEPYSRAAVRVTIG